MERFREYALLGILAGTFSSTFGVGGGILIVPALVLFFAIPQKSAQGICLAAMVPMVFAGAMRYIANPHIPVPLKTAVILGISGAAGALLGSWIAANTPAVILRKLFAVVMIIAAVRMLVKR